MITDDDYAINMVSNSRSAEAYGWTAKTRSELSISKFFATKNGAKIELNELLTNQKIRNQFDNIDLKEEIEDLIEDGYYPDSELIIFLRKIQRIINSSKRLKEKLSRV